MTLLGKLCYVLRILILFMISGKRKSGLQNGMTILSTVFLIAMSTHGTHFKERISFGSQFQSRVD